MAKISTSRIIIILLIVVVIAYILISRPPPAVQAPPQPTGSWDNVGYANGGSVMISSPAARGIGGMGYWENTIPITIENGSTVELSYAWKKGHVGGVPPRQDIYITIVKPDGTSVDVDNQLGEPPADNEWYYVENKDISSYFDSSGTYKIKLKYACITADEENSQSFAWFDEVKLVSNGNVVLTESFENDNDGWSFGVIGGWLRAVQSVDANFLDPHRTKYDWAIQVISLTYDTLMTFDENMNYIPLLAESWDIDPNGRYIDFHLRHDVKFHCGEPFNADAVVYSIRRAKSAISVSQDSVRNIQDAEALDEYTVRVTLKMWDRWLYDWFAETSSAIVCPHCAEEYGLDYGVSHFCGTGPFKVQSWERDKKLILVRNEDYRWGPSLYKNRGPAYLQGITIEVIPADLSREDAFKKGETDMMIGFAPRPAWMDWLRSAAPSVVTSITPRSSMVYVGFNVATISPEIQQGLESGTPIPSGHRVSPVNDTLPWVQVDSEMHPDNANKGLLVRQALLYATNRSEILLYAWENIGTVAYGPLTDLMWGYDPSVENMYPYDPDKARELLAQAGYADGLTLTIYTTSYDPYVKTCEQLKKQWEKVGVTLNIETRVFDDIEAIIAKADHDMWIGGWTWPNADMLWYYWHTIRVPTPGRFWWGNAYTDEIMENTFSIDDNIAFKAIQDGQKILMEDAAVIPIIERPFLLAYWNKVKGYTVHRMANFIWKHLDTYVE
jgi:peptide/nickel transport system substrate-binding protein